jgi:precorrin-6B methylase 2
LKVSPDDADWEVAKRVHAEFARKVGSEHIASEFALAHLSALLRRESPRHVLEFGAGIGTVTRLLLDRLGSDATVVAVEPNAFCLEQLRGGFDDPRLTILATRSDSVLSQKFDLVIIDGGLPRDLGFVQSGVQLFFEGNRMKTQKKIEAAAASRNLFARFEYHAQNGWRLVWRMSRFNMLLPRLRRKKGCSIGSIESG